MIEMYGIPNCGSIKKAKDWLAKHDLEYSFHDVKKEGVSEELLRQWMGCVHWSTLLNKRGLTWRKLEAPAKADLNAEKAVALLQQYPTMIKRPVLVKGNAVMVGFDAANYHQFLLADDA